VVVGVYSSLIAGIMLLVNIEKPKGLMDRLGSSKYEFVFTFRGRYLLDVFCSLFLFGMGYTGFFMGIVTLGLIFGIRLAGVQNPDAFNDMFRVPSPDPDKAHAAPGTGYAGEVMTDGEESGEYPSDPGSPYASEQSRFDGEGDTTRFSGDESAMYDRK